MKLISILVGSGLYFYVATILAQFGFNQYFNIPSSFIEVSLRDNILFFFTLSQGFWGALTVLSMLDYIVFFVLIIVAVVVYQYLKKFFKVVFIIFVLFSFVGFHNFGDAAARITTSFYTLSENCLESEEGIKYIAPIFFNSHIIFVPIEEENNKLIGGFLVKETADLECEIKYEEVGEIKK